MPKSQMIEMLRSAQKNMNIVGMEDYAVEQIDVVIAEMEKTDDI